MSEYEVAKAKFYYQDRQLEKLILNRKEITVFPKTINNKIDSLFLTGTTDSILNMIWRREQSWKKAWMNMTWYRDWEDQCKNQGLGYNEIQHVNGARRACTKRCQELYKLRYEKQQKETITN